MREPNYVAALKTRLAHDVPAYIRSDHPRFAKLLGVFAAVLADTSADIFYKGWKWMDPAVDPGRTHDSFDTDAPLDALHWFNWGEAYLAAKGSRLSCLEYFQGFHGVWARTVDSEPYLLQPSAATAIRADIVYTREVVESIGTAPALGDVLHAVMVSPDPPLYECLVLWRRGRSEDERIVKTVVLGEGTESGWPIGSEYTLVDALGEVTARVDAHVKQDFTAYTITAAGTGYPLWSTLTSPTCPGWCAVVTRVNADLGVEAISITDTGRGYTTAFEVKGLGHGLEITPSTGHSVPASAQTPRPLVSPVQIYGAHPGQEQREVIGVETRIQTGFNGVIGVGSVLTDSDLWAKKAYRLEAPVPSSDYRQYWERYHHRAGRVWAAVYVMTTELSVSAAAKAETVIATPGEMAADVHTGESSQAVLTAGPKDLASDAFHTGQTSQATLNTYIDLGAEIAGGASTTASLDESIQFEALAATGEMSIGEAE